MSSRTKLDSYSPRPFWVRYLLNYLALFLGSLLFKIKVSGHWNIPKKGPFIVAANHFNIIDPPLVIFAMRRPVTFLAASDMEVNWYEHLGMWLYGFIPTNRKQLGPSTIKSAKKVLRNDDILGIFPEGNTQDLKLRPAKAGVVYLSTTEKVKILPIGIHGLKENFFTYLFKGVRPKITINIGKPFGPFDLPRDRSKKDTTLNKIGKEVMLNIAALLPNDCHGEYSGNIQIENIRKNMNN